MIVEENLCGVMIPIKGKREMVVALESDKCKAEQRTAPAWEVNTEVIDQRWILHLLTSS